MGVRRIVQAVALAVALAAAPLVGTGAAPDSGRGQGNGGAAAHWTAARRAAAQPRDLVIDERGLGYLRRADGTLAPHGHAVPAAKPTAPGGGGSGGSGTGDTAGPTITDRVPTPGATVGATATFSATVTDPSGVRSVSVEVRKGTATPQTFAASRGTDDRWSVTIQGFTDGAWSWRVIAKDNAKKGGNTSTSPSQSFTVSTAGAGGGTVTNAEWTKGGAVQTAAGRIYFEMPNARQTSWVGYVCSGTVARDASTDDRSVIITAAHCVYDDVAKTFARNVLFIPDQASTTAAGTDTDCANDRYGCWEPDFGVVDVDWTTRVFPDNIPWDYAYYVVDDITGARGDDLDATVGDLPVQFTAPVTGAYTHALGYSYSDDPNFMYCAEDLTDLDAANWWLASCDLSGGSSGGPWIQPMDEGTGAGPIVSVNSWGYTSQPGMAGPKLVGTSASCLFDIAKAAPLATAGGITAC